MLVKSITLLFGHTSVKLISQFATVALIAGLMAGCESPGQTQQYDSAYTPVGRRDGKTWSPGQQQMPPTLAANPAKPLVENQQMYRELMAQGNVQRDRGQTSRAYQLYKQAASLNPADAAAQRQLADAAYALGKYDEAAAAYGKALAVEPDNVDLLRGVTESLLAGGQSSAALPYAEHWVRLQPDDQSARLALARAQTLLGQYDQAEQSYQKAAELGPQNPALLLGQGEVYLQQGQQDKAIAQFQKAIAMQPSALAYERLALAQMRSGRYEAAVQDYHKALDIDPNHINALNGLGVCLSRQYFLAARPDFSIRSQAVEMLQRSLRIDPQQPAIVELLSHLMKH